ncbi:MAG: hypothetical protein ICV65_10540 [Flavisolibacter sp.]|nr:hypothetical protein [Flavisolibacter sp.]
MQQLTALLLLLSLSILSRAQPLQKQKIKLFIDCSNSYCDMNFIRTQINFVDYVLDFKVADVHVLITQQSNGGGGSQYQLIFFGQNSFKGYQDTLRYNIKPNTTEFESREVLVKYLQLGLVPLLTKTEEIENISIQLKQNAKGDSLAKTVVTKDPWNYWVFNLNVNGNLNADQVYKGLRYNGNFSVTRITDKIKVRFSLSGEKNRTTYEFGDATTGTNKIIVNNNNYNFFHQLVKSLSDHWSYGYDVEVSRSTFTNYKLRNVVRPAIEYNIFPYKEVNNKLFTIRYGIDGINNNYFDTTLYLKARETLFGQALNAALTFNQKWGTINLSANAHSYFNNPKFYNVGLGGGVNVRITGGLSFNVFVFGSYLRDQIYLPKGRATEQEILTRQRQLATNYTYYTFFGISYRFGSKLNNFVNPRFEGGGNGIFFF